MKNFEIRYFNRY